MPREVDRAVSHSGMISFVLGLLLPQPHRRTGSPRCAIPDLPITPILPEICAKLESDPNLVLQAPPGAGKTTTVPLALLDAATWLDDQTILVLEPRRVAARAAASRMAALLGERVGERVGYRVRHESAVSKNTRVLVVTEGVLTRRLLRDPALRGVGAIVFDEFHERSVDADLCLALARRLQTTR